MRLLVSRMRESIRDAKPVELDRVGATNVDIATRNDAQESAMASKRRYLVCTMVLSIALGVDAAQAQPISGMTYTYDLSTPDVDPGGFPTFVRPYTDPGDTADDTLDDSNQAVITSRGRLTDGELGSMELSGAECCLFNNGTYAGFRGDPGIGLAPKPKINVDLGGRYTLDSFTLHYLVEDQPSIYSPRRVPDSNDPIEFNAVTVFGSTNGVDFTELGFSNDTNPVFGLEGDFGSGARERRSLTIQLNDSEATHLMIDVRSPWTYVFLGEFVVNGSRIGGLAGDYNNDGSVDAADYVVWRKSGIGGQQGYDDWRANFGEMSAGNSAALSFTSVPEPGALCLLGCACVFMHVIGWAFRKQAQSAVGSP
jgi:hypothetical protein